MALSPKKNLSDKYMADFQPDRIFITFLFMR